MRKAIFILISSFFIILFLLFVGIWQLSKSRSFQFFGGIIQRVNTTEKVVALTFDDGPTRENTGPVLAVLAESGVKATFFVTGRELEKNPEQGRAIVAAGHELGNHTYSHRRMIFRTLGYIKREIEKTDQLIRQMGYQGEILFRPPNGKKLLLLPYYLKQHHRKTIFWDLEPDSYPAVAVKTENTVRYVAGKIQPGSIVLLHVMYKKPIEAVAEIKGIVTALKNQGYRLVTVSELVKMSR